MGILLRDLVAALSRAFPLRTAGYEKDAVGLQVGFDSDADLRKLLVAYEVTDAVIDEAIAVGANCILTYHPLIFPNLSAITDSSRTGKLVRRLVRENIALYVLHTAFDANTSFGTSSLMAQALGLQSVGPLTPLEGKLEKLVVFVPTTEAEKVRQAMWAAGAGNIGNYDECSFAAEGVGTFRGNDLSNPVIGTPNVRESVSETRIEVIVEKWRSAAVIRAMIEAHPYEEVAFDLYPLANGHPTYGMGSIGELPQPLAPDEFLRTVSRIFKTPSLRYSAVTKPTVRRIALLGGAGMDYYRAALAAGADVFVTGDVRYHDFYRAEHDGMLLVDAGHAETEQWVVAGMRNALASVELFVDLHPDVHDSFIVESRIVPNAVQYHLEQA